MLMHEIQGRAVGTHSAKHARAGVSGLTYLPTIYTFIFVNTVINTYVCLTLLLIRHPPPSGLAPFPSGPAAVHFTDPTKVWVLLACVAGICNSLFSYTEWHFNPPPLSLIELQHFDSLYLPYGFLFISSLLFIFRPRQLRRVDQTNTGYEAAQHPT